MLTGPKPTEHKINPNNREQSITVQRDRVVSGVGSGKLDFMLMRVHSEQFQLILCGQSQLRGSDKVLTQPMLCSVLLPRHGAGAKRVEGAVLCCVVLLLPFAVADKRRRCLWPSSSNLRHICIISHVVQRSNKPNKISTTISNKLK